MADLSPALYAEARFFGRGFCNSDRHANLDETLDRLAARAGRSAHRDRERLGSAGRLYTGAVRCGAGRFSLPLPAGPRYPDAGRTHPHEVGRRALQQTGAAYRLPRHQRRAALSGAALRLCRGAALAHVFRPGDAVLFGRDGLRGPLRADSGGVPDRRAPSGVAEQADQRAAADGAGDRLDDRRRADRLDADGQVAENFSDRSGCFGGDPAADFQGQHPRLRIGDPALGQRHAPGGRLDRDAEVRRRRHRGRGDAHNRQDPQLRQYDHHGASLLVGERIVPELAGDEAFGRAARAALGADRHDDGALLHPRDAQSLPADRAAARLPGGRRKTDARLQCRPPDRCRLRGGRRHAAYQSGGVPQLPATLSGDTRARAARHADHGAAAGADRYGRAAAALLFHRYGRGAGVRNDPVGAFRARAGGGGGVRTADFSAAFGARSGVLPEAVRGGASARPG